MPDRPKVGIGTFILRGDQLLLGYRLNAHAGNVWSPPGGHLEYGETPAETASRETAEECGIRIPATAWKLCAVTNDVFAESGKHYITLHLWAAAPESAEAQLCEPEKWREWRWFDVRQIPEDLMPPVVQALKSGLKLTSLGENPTVPANF